MADHPSANTPRPFAELRDEGLLWLINRTTFHPRGFALAIFRDKNGDAVGWSMLGDGTELWNYSDDVDDANFAKAEAFLNSLRPAPAPAPLPLWRRIFRRGRTGRG